MVAQFYIEALGRTGVPKLADRYTKNSIECDEYSLNEINSHLLISIAFIC